MTPLLTPPGGSGSRLLKDPLGYCRDRQWLTNLHSEKEIRGFERAGDYVGWRVGIRTDGTWLFFVSGD